MSNTNELHGKRSTKEVSFRQLKTVSIVIVTKMGRTYKNNKMKSNLFVLVDIWNNEL